MLINDKTYVDLLNDIKTRIREAQRNAVVSVNGELINLYWNIGRIIDEKSVWGNKFVENLERDIRLEFPGAKGYSRRNLKYMAKFYRENQDIQIVQTVSAQIPWSHNVAIMDKVKDAGARLWYLAAVREYGWTHTVLVHQIDSQLYERQVLAGKIDNFKLTLPAPQSELVQKTTKDPYIFDFLDKGADEWHERKIEQALVDNVAKLLMELGTGFAYVGNQYKLTVDGQEFFIDLLFYNLELRRYFVVELKNTEFKPEFAGKLNFYLTAVDEQIKKNYDEPTIGLLLCKGKNSVIAEYALRGITSPIGVSEFKMVKKLPKNLEDILPSAEDIKTRIKMD